MSYIKAIPSVLSKTAAYTVSTNDGDNVQVNTDATSGAVTITLYAASTNTGKIVTVKKTDSSANAVTIDGNASETIDGATTLVLAKQYDSATLTCNGTNWTSVAVAGQTYNGQTISSAASFTGTLGVSGLLTVSGFGTHSFSAGGTGANNLKVINTTAGAANLAGLTIDSDVENGLIQAYSSTYTTSGTRTQSALAVRGLASGGLVLSAEHASGAIKFYSGGTSLRATIDTAGNLIFNPTGANGTVNIGGTTDTGTTVVRNSGGYLWQQSSSLRFKENISSWSIGDAPGQVSLDALRKFVALSPSLWDYKGKHNGAAGFISENLDALPIRNVYGTSPLINYNSDGLPESNRDFALIGLQHLVLQQHDATISQLAARIAALEGRQ